MRPSTNPWDLGIGSFSIDVAKIRTRKEVLFPFLTLDLHFLNDLAPSAVDDETGEGSFANPYAQFLAGEIAFEQGNLDAARQWWDGITPDSADSYVVAYKEVLDALRSHPGADVKAIRRALDGVRGRWRMFSYQRLRQFGHACDTF